MKQTAPVSTAIVFVLALNLRPAVTSLGAALEDVSLAPGMTAAVGAVLVALPLWASGLGGWITPWLRARIGIHRAVSWALVILGISLIVRVQSGPDVLLAGTALACLAIAVVGTVLPVLVQPASSRTKASFTLALGTGSTIGALVTPTLVAAFSWQFALAGWALLALVTLQVWQRAPRSSMVIMARALSPRQLFHSKVAWHLTLYFGLVSTLTFLIMGWLPAILRDAGISASYAGFCLALSMAMGLPMMWLVPFGVHRMRRPGILVVVLAALNGVGVIGLLVAPAVMPWLWSTGLGLGMGGLAMALTTISARAAGNPDITTALSGMVQGLGYFLAGAGALACGLVHSATGSWELPLIMALIVLCGQIWSGVRAARPIVVAPRPLAALEPAKPKPDLTHLDNGVRVTAKAEPEHQNNGVRVTANSDWESVRPESAHPANGVRVTAKFKPEQSTNGAWGKAMADPDVTQPVSGVWVAAVDDLESIKSLTNGVRVTAMAESVPESDVTHLVNGVRVTAAAEPGPESGLVHSVNGVRVTAKDEAEPVKPESEPDLACSANGVRVTGIGEGEPVRPESDVSPVLNGVPVAGVGGPESVAARSDVAHGTDGEPEPESDVVPVSDGVRGAGVGEAEPVQLELELILLTDGVRVTAMEPEPLVNGVRVTALADAAIPLPRQPLVGPVRPVAQPETAIQEG